MWMLLSLACPKQGADTGPADPPGGPLWRCTAYVAIAPDGLPVVADGADDAEAWARACVVLPATDPPGRCAPEEPPDGWTWIREATADRVILRFTPQPVPFRGEGESTDREEACAAAYDRACAAAGAFPGCEGRPGFDDGGVEAVEGAGGSSGPR